MNNSKILKYANYYSNNNYSVKTLLKAIEDVENYLKMSSLVHTNYFTYTF